MIMFARGCCCETDCTPIAEDNFNRSNTTNINTSAPFTWSGDTSAARIFSNRLAFWAVFDARLKCGTAHPDSTGSGIVYCTFELNSDDDYVEVWLNGTDEDNCTVARLTRGSPDSTLDIRTRIANVDTVVASKPATISSSGIYVLKLLFDASTGNAKAVVTDEDDVQVQICISIDLIDEIGYYAGIGVESFVESDIYAEDFTYTPLGDGSNQCEIFSCPPCEIGGDSFDRSNSSNVNTSAPFVWSGDTGSFSISSNRMSATNGRLMCGNPGEVSSGIVSCYVQGNTNGDNLDVWLNGTSSADCIIGRLSVGPSATLSIIERVGGSNTTLHSISVSASTGVEHYLVLSYDADNEAAMLTLNQIPNVSTQAAICVRSVSAVGVYAGVGAQVSSSGQFDDFSYQQYKSDINDCEKGYCGCTSALEVCGLNLVDADYTSMEFDVQFPAGMFTADGCSAICAFLSSPVTMSNANVIPPSISGVVEFELEFDTGDSCPTGRNYVTMSMSCGGAGIGIEFVFILGNDTAFKDVYRYHLDVPSGSCDEIRITPADSYVANNDGGYCVIDENAGDIIITPH